MTTNSTPSSIIVRSYQPADLTACQEIFVAGHRSYDHPMTFINHILETDMADIEKNYLQVPNGHWWVAVSTDDNRVVGHVAVLPLSLADPSYYYDELSEEERDQSCELQRMCVAPDAQRAGVGRKLISTVIDFAREKGYRQIQLATLASMDRTCAFYEKNGFIKGQIDKTPFDIDSSKSVEGLQEVIGNPPKLMIFKPGDVIPQEDLRLMKMSPVQSKYAYVQHYSMIL